MRDANRAQARNISQHLHNLGYDCDSGDTPFPSVEEFDEETTLLLAQNEHIRWMNERMSAGWIYNAVRNNEKKHHPMLVQWDELPEDEKKKDFDVAKNIIPLLKSVGLRVYKTI